MVQQGSPDSGEEAQNRFFQLIITKQKVGNLDTRIIKSMTIGIEPYEVVIAVEAWLENAKEQLKQPIKDSLQPYK